MKTYDYLVVGGGIAGTSVAGELGRRASVCLVEAEARPGVHATGRSAALFAPTYGGREIRALTRASREFFDRAPAGFSHGRLLTPRGCLYIARADQAASLAAMQAAIRDSGGTATRLTKAEALHSIPQLRGDYVDAALLDENAMDIDVDALHQGYLRTGRQVGVDVRVDSRIASLDRRAGLWETTLGGDTIRARIIVNAAGAWADGVGALCGARPIGLQPMRRTAVLVEPPRGADITGWPAIIDVDEQFYFKPDAGKLLISPADETPVEAGDAQPEELDIAIGADRVQAALDIDIRRVAHSWAGLRTFAPDRVPVVGFDPRVEGLFWCAGQGGYGIQTAPALARTAAALALHEGVPEDVAAEGLAAESLSPARFLAASLLQADPGAGV